MKKTPVTITYAHAVQDPWDGKIAKPFELRQVQALIWLERCDDGFNCNVEIDGELFGAWETTKDEAIEWGLHDAEYTLMDRSREPWREVKKYDENGKICNWKVA